MYEKPFSNPFDEDQKLGWKPIVWMLLAATLGCCILLAAAFFFFQFDLASVVAQYLQSPTPGPNLTTTAAIIEATAISAQDQWRLNLSETFDNNNYDWYVGTYDDEFAKTAYEVKDGKYHWTVTAHKGTIQWIQISPKSFSNFFMTMEVEAPNSLVNSDHGIIFRQDSDSNFYYFGITSEPGYFVSINHKEQWKMLIPYAKSPAIRSKGPNRLAILAQGTHFIFLINDQFVAELTNSQIETGKIALAIELYDANDQGNYQFDNIELRVPAPPATPTPTITLTPTITPTPTITLTPHALIPAPADAKVFNEQFDSNKKNWVSSYNGNTIIIKEGKLYLKSREKGFQGLALCDGCPIYRKAFYFQAEVIPEKRTDVEHGISFCAKKSSRSDYVFMIDSISGTYSLNRRTRQGWQTPFDAVYSQSISKYPISNTLAVQFDQGKMNLYINGNLVNTYTDPDPITCGTIGIYINDGPVDVIADNVFAYEIKETTIPTLTPTP